MHKFQFSQFHQQTSHIEYLEVQSFEVNVYLVKLTVDGITGFVYDKTYVRWISSEYKLKTLATIII